MSRVIIAIAVLLVLAWGCVDPGCIRNSECGVGYNCQKARCVVISSGSHVAGKSATSTAGKTGTVSDAGQSSTPKPPSDAGSSEPTPVVDAAAPDTGAM
ncbi:MAG TPA: hypothetical protein VGI70_11175 [Polyangiales bacterium]